MEALAQCASPSSVKPDAPQLYPDVDFSEDDPLEATVQWAPPVWPPHKVLVCQFYYRRCQEMAWTLVSVRDPFPPTLLWTGPGTSFPNQTPSSELIPQLALESVHIPHRRPVHASCSAKKCSPKIIYKFHAVPIQIPLGIFFFFCGHAARLWLRDLSSSTRD